MKATLLSLLLLAPCASADLEVHEWGTFTTLASSSGTPLNWYLPQNDLSALPEFVERNPMAAKLAAFGMMRMETPVIYFYPDAPMPVKVRATLQNGSITEIYPRPSGLLSFVGGSQPVKWEGDLFPPDHRESLAIIPQVASDQRGGHYAAAREVPEAWIFRHKFDVRDPKTEITTTHEQAEKFIFYRGVAQTAPLLAAQDGGNDQVAFTNRGPSTFKEGVILEVRGDHARWTALPQIAGRGPSGPPVKLAAALPEVWKPLAETEAELVSWFHQKLAGDGLTPAEARAMVATWQGAWFREPGLRAFTLLPREWIDTILPLKVEPKPDQLVRVFVARFELLQAKQEQILTDLLMDERIPDDQALQTLKGLELGRFEQAAVQRATEIAAQRMQTRFQSLKAPTATSMR